ncbi:MAG TPA: glycosyltransferase family 2 protein [Myxococcota bacterium]
MALSVSVVIPTYNRAHLVGRALASALAQVTPLDEILVVDDGSSDGTEQALADYRDRIRYLRTPNRGAGAARNRGIREATRDLVAFLDSDDEWMPGKLELARRWLAARPDVLFVFSEFGVTDGEGRERRRHLIHWHRDARGWDEILGPGAPYSAHAALPEGIPDFPVHVGSLYQREFARGYVLTTSLVARRVEAGDALHFAEDVPTLEDLECFGRLSRRGLAAFFDCETAWQHGHAGERLSEYDSLRRAEANLVVLARVWGADPAFLATHGAEYQAVVDDLRASRAADLILLGRLRDAREELARMQRPPLGHKLLAGLPGPLVKLLLGLRGRLRAAS